MTRFVAFTRVVSVVVGLFLGIGVASCSKSPSAPTPTPQPPVVVVPPPGAPPVMNVPSGFVSFRDVATGAELPLTARFVTVLPKPSVKIVGGPPGGCDEYSTNCFQWKIELCTGDGVARASAQVHLSPKEGESGFSGGGFGTDVPGCVIGEKLVKIVYDQNGKVVGMDGISSFPTGVDCCRYINLIGHFVLNGRVYEGEAVASFFVNYENRTP